MLIFGRITGCRKWTSLFTLERSEVRWWDSKKTLIDTTNYSVSWQQSMASYSEQHTGLIRLGLPVLVSGSLMRTTSRENMRLHCYAAHHNENPLDAQSVSCSVWTFVWAPSSFIKLTSLSAHACRRFSSPWGLKVLNNTFNDRFSLCLL